MIMQNIMPESIHAFNSGKNKSSATESKSKSTDVFSDIMNLNLNKNSKTMPDSKRNQTESRIDIQNNLLVKETNAKKESVNATNPAKIKESANSYANSIDNENSLTKAKAKEIKDTLDQLQSKVQSSLDLSTEEFEQFLENLGFSMYDLLNPDNMKQFVLQANGSGDITSVLTDEKLAESMNQLLQLVNEINQEITLPKDVVQELLAKESTVMDTVEATNNNSSVESDNGINATVIIVNNSSSITDNVNLLDKQSNTLVQTNTSVDNTLLGSNLDSANALNDKGQLATVIGINTTEENSQIINKNTYITTDSIVNVVDDDTPAITYNMSEDTSLAENNNSLSKESNASESNLMNKETLDLNLASEKDSDINTQLDGYFNNLINLSQNSSINPETTLESIKNFRDIVNQIVEQLKIVINSEQTSMELQLNPESLGKINLSLVSKDGVMTAHFTTQNEVTKEAIESQMQILKDNLNSQGLKVESIEVTVSNFEFGQNSQAFANDNQSNNSQNRGFIQFDEDLESPKNEDITLINDLMEQMGSSVSYTA